MSETETIVAPESENDLVEAVLSTDKVLPCGNRTKAVLTADTNVCLLSTSKLKGIVEYEPSEFTFTAYAGTTIKEITEALTAKNQYLPFDPLLAHAGATLGGTVVSGLSGPGRFRFGGVRDFLLGVRFVSGDGKIIQTGGKVVKNAAGFDIPKLMIGSLGQYGALSQLTFKVFPKPPAVMTIQISCGSHQQAADRLSRLGNSRYELDAIDYRAAKKAIYARLRGPSNANEDLADEIRSADLSPIEVLDSATATAFWLSINELKWHQPGAIYLKVPTTIAAMQRLSDKCDDLSATAVHFSSAGSQAWIATDENDINALHTELCRMELPALALFGNTNRIRWGHREPQPIEQRIKQAMDPSNRFSLRDCEP